MNADLSVLKIEYCGEWYEPSPDTPFTIGREGDLVIDDNPFLHRTFLQIVSEQALWWIYNAGSRLAATVTESSGYVQAWLAPGARMPIVFPETSVLFSAGPTTYEVRLLCDQPTFGPLTPPLMTSGGTTMGATALTLSQRQLLVALAEPLLRRDGSGSSAIPTSAAASARLGWNLTRFNRKLDNVCEKFDKQGVAGLRGASGRLAVNRRARLVEYVVASRLVSADDLALLDLETTRS